MRLQRFPNCGYLHRAILRIAASLVPCSQRREWLAEWRAELHCVAPAYHFGSSNSWQAQWRIFTFCLGAFSDALWLRRNNADGRPRKIILESPLQCGFILTTLAIATVFFAFRLPGARDSIVPLPYRGARDLMMISADGHNSGRRPTIPLKVYRSLATRAQYQFADLAFYQPARASVGMIGGQTPTLAVAYASSNLFELLGVPVAGAAERESLPRLVLSRTVWRRYFHSDPHIVKKILVVAGVRARVAGLLPDKLWRLPGQVDVWLLADTGKLAALSPTGKNGFVVARAGTTTPRSSRDWQWRLSLPNDRGGVDRFECLSLGRGPLVLPSLLMIPLAILILPAITSLNLGEYPPNRHRPRGAIRFRRWIFLALKSGLVVVIVFFGCIDVASITATLLQPQGFLIGYIFAFRWVLLDQRKRCPVCLRLLVNPARIGQRSQIFLGWYGTELMCTRGHGLLHIPEVPMSAYSIQRWLYLDPSWSGLFSA